MEPEKEKEKPVSQKKKKEQQSILASKVEDYLRQFNIPYIKEARFHNCRDRNPLPFDFIVFIDGKVGVIEVDGEQHFVYTSIFHKKPDALEKQQKRDVIKNCFTIDQNMSLLRISYDEKAPLPLLARYIAAIKTQKTRVEIFSSPLLYINPYGKKKDDKLCIIS
jgi:signal peptidase I